MPAIGVAVQLATRRRLDGVGGLVLASVVAAIAASLITHSPRFLLAKDGLITAVWGCGSWPARVRAGRRRS